MKELRTIFPYGLNNKLDGKNWKFKDRDDIIGKVFNHSSSKRGKRGSKKYRKMRKKYL